MERPGSLCVFRALVRRSVATIFGERSVEEWVEGVPRGRTLNLLDLDIAKLSLPNRRNSHATNVLNGNFRTK